MVQLFTSEAFKFGQKNIIPFAGEVEISNEGVIEVEQEIADQIIAADCGWSLLDSDSTTTTTVAQSTTTTTEAPIKPQTEGDDLGKTQDSDIGGTEEDDLSNSASAEPSAERQALEQHTKADLQKMVKDFPRSEWGTLTKDGLIDYILKKTK